MDSFLESMTITLSRPYSINGGEPRETLVMNEPKLVDKILFSKDKGSEEERTVRMMARLLNLESETHLYQLPACDYSKLEIAFNEMLKDPSERSAIS
ncbi:phage tail assembly protein [Salmonella enterica]